MVSYTDRSKLNATQALQWLIEMGADEITSNTPIDRFVIKNQNNKIYSNGGRVLNFVIKSKNLKKSRNDLIKVIENLNWKNGYFRKDIGFRVIQK